MLRGMFRPQENRNDKQAEEENMSQGLGGGGRPLGRYLVMGVRNREERKRDKGKKRKKRME